MGRGKIESLSSGRRRKYIQSLFNGFRDVRQKIIRIGDKKMTLEQYMQSIQAEKKTIQKAAQEKIEAVQAEAQVKIRVAQKEAQEGQIKKEIEMLEKLDLPEAELKSIQGRVDALKKQLSGGANVVVKLKG